MVAWLPGAALEGLGWCQVLGVLGLVVATACACLAHLLIVSRRGRAGERARCSAWAEDAGSSVVA